MAEMHVVRAVATAIDGDAEARRFLSARIAADPLQKALFPSGGMSVDDRLRLYETLEPVYCRTLDALGIEAADPGFLFDLLVPLTFHLARRIAELPRNCLIGLGGGPGAGKTTLSRLLADCLPLAVAKPIHCLSLSLDDFYRSREERLRRGFRWRTLPGTHDTDRLKTFVRDFDRAAAPLAVPRYDLGRDAPKPDETLPTAPDVCIFDGAMVGTTLPGYAVLSRRLDVMIYLDAEVALLKHWRFDRERRIRERSGGAAGFPPPQMRAFWNEALKPSIEKWVMPNAKTADLVIGIGPGRTVCGARGQGAAAGTAKVAEVLKDG